MTSQPNPPRRDRGGKLPAGLTPINPATGEPIIHWKTDPGPKVSIPEEYAFEDPAGSSAWEAIAEAIRAQVHEDYYNQPPMKVDSMKRYTAHHVVSFEAIDDLFRAACSGCDWTAEGGKLAELNRRGRDHERYWTDHQDAPEEAWHSEKVPPEADPEQRSQPDDYTIVEVVEELPAGQHPEDQEMVKINRVFINGTPVRVVQDGIFIDYGKDAEPGPPGNVVRVHLELLVDEFRIRRVRHGYGQPGRPRFEVREDGGLHFEVTSGEIDAETQNRFDRLMEKRNQQRDKYKDR